MLRRYHTIVLQNLMMDKWSDKKYFKIVFLL
jgi:hypothetical protein